MHRLAAVPVSEDLRSVRGSAGCLPRNLSSFFAAHDKKYRGLVVMSSSSSVGVAVRCSLPRARHQSRCLPHCYTRHPQTLRLPTKHFAASPRLANADHVTLLPLADVITKCPRFHALGQQLQLSNPLPAAPMARDRPQPAARQRLQARAFAAALAQQVAAHQRPEVY